MFFESKNHNYKSPVLHPPIRMVILQQLTILLILNTPN
jgi:hypothetical protein